jgi:hypothetical protein
MPRHFLTIVFVLAITTFGCRRSDDQPKNLPKLFPIVVTVHQEGTPVAGAFVRLVPTDASMPWSCGATTDTSGRAVIKTIGKFTGAPEGDYRVAISKLEMPAIAGSNMSNLDAPAASGQSDSFDLVDPKYSNPSTTPLEAKVGKDNPKVEFNVGPAVRTKREGPH